MKYVTQYKFSIIFLITVLLSSNGCAVQYIADYDASIKDEIVQVAKKVDLFWGALLDTQSADRKYDKFKGQYNQIETDIRGLVMKNEIRALNKESTKQANIALELWVEDRSIHKENDGFSDFEAKQHRKQFNRVFTAMAKGEEAKNISTTNDSEGDKQ
jgi:hypothetical protein